MPRKTKESKVVPALPVSTRCRLTRPSSGRPRAGFAPLWPPFMSNVWGLRQPGALTF